MMTPQEAASSTFPKATLGGYNMAAVDVFLDKLIEDYTALYKDNSALKAKIKVLVDKMEEYHAMEDTMRSTLLTAQKMANSMVAEAEQKSAAMVADSERSVRRRIAELQNEAAEEEQRLSSVRAEIDKKIEAEHERLAAAQQELQDFLKSYKKLCQKQLEFIDRLPELRLLPDGFDPPAATEAIPDTAAEPAPQEPLPAAPDLEDTRRIVSPEPEAAEASANTGDTDVTAALDGDANALIQSMQNVINVFSHPEGSESGVSREAAADTSSAGELDFESDMISGTAEDDPFADENDEKESATRVLNLDDLQFGRNYTKG